MNKKPITVYLIFRQKHVALNSYLLLTQYPLKAGNFKRGLNTVFHNLTNAPQISIYSPRNLICDNCRIKIFKDEMSSPAESIIPGNPAILGQSGFFSTHKVQRLKINTKPISTQLTDKVNIFQIIPTPVSLNITTVSLQSA